MYLRALHDQILKEEGIWVLKFLATCIIFGGVIDENKVELIFLLESVEFFN